MRQSPTLRTIAAALVGVLALGACGSDGPTSSGGASNDVTSAPSSAPATSEPTTSARSGDPAPPEPHTSGLDARSGDRGLDEWVSDLADGLGIDVERWLDDLERVAKEVADRLRADVDDPRDMRVVGKVLTLLIPSATGWETGDDGTGLRIVLDPGRYDARMCRAAAFFVDDPARVVFDDGADHVCRR